MSQCRPLSPSHRSLLQDEEGYRQKLELDSENASVLCDYGVLLSREGRLEEAAHIFEKVFAAKIHYPCHVT